MSEKDSKLWFSRRTLGWLGVVALIALIFGIQQFWTLYHMPDQLGTILYNAYLGSDTSYPGAVQELNSLSTYYEETGQEGSPRAVVTGYRFSVEGRALVVTSHSLNSWVAGRIISRVRSGAQLRADMGPEATEALRRKSWRQTSAELRRLGLTRLILRNDDGESWETELQ
jgi:hypothetical protein